MKKSLKGIFAVASSLAVLSTAAVAATLSASAADDTAITFKADQVQITLDELAAAGNKVAVTVAVTDNTVGFTAYNFRMAFDEKLVDAAPVEFAKAKVTNVGSRVAGAVIANFAFSGDANDVVTGDAELFTMTFTLPADVKEGDKFEINFDNEGYSNFQLANTIAGNNALTSNPSNGFIEILEEEETTTEEVTTTEAEETTTEAEETTTTDSSPATGSRAPLVEMAAVIAVIGGAVAIATKKRK